MANQKIPPNTDRQGPDRRTFLLALPATPLALTSAPMQVEQDSAFVQYATHCVRKAVERGKWKFLSIYLSVLTCDDPEKDRKDMDQLTSLGYLEFGCSECGVKGLPQGILSNGSCSELCQECRAVEVELFRRLDAINKTKRYGDRVARASEEGDEIKRRIIAERKGTRGGAA